MGSRRMFADATAIHNGSRARVGRPQEHDSAAPFRQQHPPETDRHQKANTEIIFALKFRDSLPDDWSVATVSPLQSLARPIYRQMLGVDLLQVSIAACARTLSGRSTISNASRESMLESRHLDSAWHGRSFYSIAFCFLYFNVGLGPIRLYNSRMRGIKRTIKHFKLRHLRQVPHDRHHRGNNSSSSSSNSSSSSSNNNKNNNRASAAKQQQQQHVNNLSHNRIVIQYYIFPIFVQTYT